MNVLSLYYRLLTTDTSSPIGGHLDVMRKYALEVDSVVEFGVKNAASTSAWLMAEPKRVICYDINNCYDNLKYHRDFAKKKGIDFQFIIGDSRIVEIEEVDLLFIDTDHTYEQLTEELNHNGDKAKKYIICHDTVAFQGCMRAIEDYIKRNHQWQIKEHFKHANGLTILEKRV